MVIDDTSNRRNTEQIPRRGDATAMPENIVRLRKDPIHMGTRLLFALVLTLGMIVFASVATQRSAHAGVAPAAIGIAHQCETIGTAPNGNQAVVCSDINDTRVPGGIEVWGTGEYFCQGPSVQCAGISASNNLLGTNPTFSVGNTPYQCRTTACPNGGRAMVSTQHVFLQSGVCTTLVGTVDNSASILVNGTSTAFHPTTLHASVNFCVA